MAFGGALRLNHYFGNRSFYADEAWLAFDCLVRSFSDIWLTRPYAADFSIVPIGFSSVEKFSSILLGNQEFSFRLFPLLCGLSAIPLFYLLLKKIIRPQALPIALALFVLSDALIYYSAECKQYSTELLVTLGIYLFVAYQRYDSQPNRFILLLNFLGMTSLLFSYSATLVMAGVALTLTMVSILNKDPKRVKRLFVVWCFWVFSFFIIQWPAVHFMIGNDLNVRYARDLFMPHPVLSLKAGIWLVQSIENVIDFLTGMPLPVIGFLLVIVGGRVLFHRDKTWFFFLSLPILLALIASSFNKYPFLHRFLLFASPAIFIFIAEGVWALISRAGRRAVILSAVLLLLLFGNSLVTAFYYLSHERPTANSRAAVLYLKEHQQQGDALFINHSAQFTYWYYMGYKNLNYSIDPVGRISDEVFSDEQGAYAIEQDVSYVFNKSGVVTRIVGLDGHLNVVDKDSLTSLGRNKRTWFLFAKRYLGPEDFILDLLKNRAVKLDEFTTRGGAVYLYDLSSVNK